ncbi:MAG TPA: hypothetical protein VN345_00395 [Blastocatellia bacterium]|nr:hypothetical protein [Blastocatellia bacterium]
MSNQASDISIKEVNLAQSRPGWIVFSLSAQPSNEWMAEFQRIAKRNINPNFRPSVTGPNLYVQYVAGSDPQVIADKATKLLGETNQALAEFYDRLRSVKF